MSYRKIYGARGVGRNVKVKLRRCWGESYVVVTCENPVGARGYDARQAKENRDRKIFTTPWTNLRRRKCRKTSVSPLQKNLRSRETPYLRRRKY